MPAARILIVEDERQTVDELRDLFEQHGYETEVALSKQVAINILNERNMDIAIINTKVQDISGIEILRDLKKINPNLPVIMISSQKLKRIESASLKEGASVFLSKPLDHATILHTIENLLESRFAPSYLKKKGFTRKEGKK